MRDLLRINCVIIANVKNDASFRLLFWSFCREENEENHFPSRVD